MVVEFCRNLEIQQVIVKRDTLEIVHALRGMKVIVGVGMTN
jgi:hypothetical protein